VFNDNLINLSDGDARKQIVKEFLENPVNKKEGWKSKDARFFRLGFQKVAKENKFNVMNIGVTPTPSRSKTNKGSMNINVKSKQKNPAPMTESIKPPTEEEKKLGAGFFCLLFTLMFIEPLLVFEREGVGVTPMFITLNLFSFATF